MAGNNEKRYDFVKNYKNDYAKVILNCIKHFIDEKGREKMN